METFHGGTVAECLEHLRTGPKRNIELLCEFTDKQLKAVLGWLYEKPPAGEQWVRTVGLFLLNGWRVAEVANDEMADLIRLWAFNTLKPEDIKQEIGYSSPSNQHLLRSVYGLHPMTPASEKLLRQLIATYSTELTERSAELLEQYRFDTEEQIAQTELHEDPIKSLADLLTTAKPLIKHANSGEVSDADRQRLRKLVGAEAFTALAVELSQMKTARTRAIALGEV